MNYNSTHAIIKEATNLGLLIRFKPPLEWAAEPRVFLMTRLLNLEISEGLRSKDSVQSARWGKLQADISYFVEGGYINWGLMKWLEPHSYEHWEIKSVRPKPSLRVFGRFACPDVFVGTHVKQRASLKGKWSLEFEIEKLTCEELWKDALGDTPPFSATAYEEYITENAKKDVRIEP